MIRRYRSALLGAGLCAGRHKGLREQVSRHLVAVLDKLRRNEKHTGVTAARIRTNRKNPNLGKLVDIALAEL